MFKWCKKIISLHKIGNISQTIHPYILRHHGGGSASFCEVHSSARFRVDCSVTPIVVDLRVQGFSGDDPRGGAPPLKGVWSFHAFLDLFPWSWFAILCGLTYWKQKHRNEPQERTDLQVQGLAGYNVAWSQDHGSRRTRSLTLSLSPQLLQSPAWATQDSNNVTHRLSRHLQTQMTDISWNMWC